MKVKAVLAVGLLTVSQAALAAPPVRSGIEGALGDELFYNFAELYVGRAYVEGGANSRLSSDSNYGVGGSVFLFDPVYAVVNYDMREFTYSQTVAGTPPTTVRTDVDQERLSVGLGARLAVAYATDLFTTITYEQLTQDIRNRPSGTLPATPGQGDAEGLGVDIGLRSFVSNFAELFINYRYRELEENKAAAGFKRATFENRGAVVGATVPVYGGFSVFIRAEIGTAELSSGGGDTDYEHYLFGGRMNFRLPR